jgi:hypothetical protein
MINLVRQLYVVNPTPTDVLTVNTRDERVLSGIVKNTDGSQTVDGVLLARAFQGDDAGVSTFADLAAIGPGEARPFTIRTDCFDELVFRFTASGAGLTINLSLRGDGGRR